MSVAIAAFCIALVPATASAAPVKAKLHVEAAGKALDPGTTYKTDTQKFKTDTRTACGGTGATKTVAGPTAMGLLGSGAAKNPKLRPLGISDKFSFGLTVCGVGTYVGFESTSYWLYKVNHKSPEVGGDQYKLKAGDDVLWFFQDTKIGTNTGDELTIKAPATATAGRAFVVTVYSYDMNGKRKRASGVKVGGKLTGSNGTAKIKPAKAGRLRLRATRGKDIADSDVVRVVKS